MYDEYERAVGGKNREGLSFLGWLSIALGTIFALGVVGVAVAAITLRSHVAEVAHVIAHELEVGPAMAAAEMVDRLESHTHLISATPEEGVLHLQDLGSGPPAEAFMEDFFGQSMEFFDGEDAFSLDLHGNEDGGFLEIDAGDEKVRMDLVRDEDGGSLVIDSNDGRVRFDLKKTDTGGYLSIDSDDGQVRFDLMKSDAGGSLVITSDEGEVRFDVTTSDDGGSLVIETTEESFKLGAGSDAEAMPRWVPRMEWMPNDPKRVYSLESEEGFMGAVAWQTDAEPSEVLAAYRGWLEGEGYEIESVRRENGESGDRTSLWARNEASERMIYVVADRLDAETSILLGYGEGGE